MSVRDTLAQLLFMDERAANSIINSAFREYAQLISDIYNDIYDSCIALYYATYTPTKYDRHGDLSGFNLYSASDIYSSDLIVNLSLQGARLLPYEGKNGSRKRDKVLDTVLDGLRGAGSRKTPPGWPMSWDAYYPNEYSKFSEWESSASTLDGIMREFSSRGPKDLSDKFYEFIENNI